MIRLLLILTLLTSCRAMQETTIETTQSDSVVYVDRTIVDTFRVPSETLEFLVPFEVLKVDTLIQFKNGRASTKLTYTNGNIKIDTKCDSLEKLVLRTEKYIKQQKSFQKSINSKSKIITKPVRWYHKTALWVCLLFTLYFIGKLLFNIHLKSIK